MAVAFDVTAPIAMFRRPYTTTISFIPFTASTAIAGLLGAIIICPTVVTAFRSIGTDERYQNSCP